MKLIMCVDENWGIGKDGDLLVKIPDDLKMFKQMTEGDFVVMGRKTLESLPNSEPLKDRFNIVFTKQYLPVNHSNLAFIRNYMELMTFNKIAQTFGKNMWVIGGQSVVENLLPFIDEAHITYVKDKFNADRYIPNFDFIEGWEMVEESPAHRYNDLEYTYRHYKKK